MQAGDHELRSDEEQNHRSDAEEFLQIDADAAFDKHHAKRHGSNYAEKCAEETKQFSRVQRNRGENEDGFYAFPQDHQKYECKKSKPRVAPRQQPNFALDLTLELPAGLHHENDHGDDEEGSSQHDPAFENVLIPASAGEQGCDPEAANEGGDQCGVDGFAQLWPVDFGKVGQRNAHDQGSLDTFPQSYDECF